MIRQVGGKANRAVGLALPEKERTAVAPLAGRCVRPSRITKNDRHAGKIGKNDITDPGEPSSCRASILEGGNGRQLDGPAVLAQSMLRTKKVVDVLTRWCMLKMG